MEGLLAYLVVLILVFLWLNKWVDLQANQRAQAKQLLPAKPEFLVEFIGQSGVQLFPKLIQGSLVGSNQTIALLGDFVR